MKPKLRNKYSVAAIMFMAAAAVFVAIALNINFGEFITAAFIISAMVSAMTGIFIFTFSEGEPVDPQLVGILPVQGCINLCRILSDLGISGNAYFLPPRVTGENRIIQFNPSLPYDGSAVYAKGSFPKTGPAGLVSVPSCDPLIQVLRKRNSLRIPNNEENITQLLREIIIEILEFAPKVSVRWKGSTVTLTFHNYRFIGGCQAIAREFPGCCIKSPCPVCSLCSSLIAEGTDKAVTLEKCTISSSFRDVTAVVLIVPSQTDTSY